MAQQKSSIKQNRYFLKDSVRKKIDFSKTDQNQMKPPPPVQKPYPSDATLIDLQDFGDIGKGIDLRTAMARRESRREFAKTPLGLDELAFLLWATQGVRETLGPETTLRTVPSAGARHPFETYLAAFNVDGLEPGLYRYLPLEHKLLFVYGETGMSEKLASATMGQRSPALSAVTFIWTAIPYRTEWRYGLAAHKEVALDAGHVGQNLYLACEAIDAGVCAIAAYDQGLMDRFLRVDGDEEFTIYLAPLGKRA